MSRLSFWHKLAFIANLCWLATWALRYYSMPTGHIQSSVMVTGLITANIVNVVVNLFTGIQFLRGKLPPSVPRWLMLANFAFLLPQLYLFAL